MTGDHLPIRGLRYPGGLLPRPGDPDGVRLLTFDYSVVLLDTAGTAHDPSGPCPSDLLARQFMSAVPTSTSWVRHDCSATMSQCLLSPQQISFRVDVCGSTACTPRKVLPRVRGGANDVALNSSTPTDPGRGAVRRGRPAGRHPPSAAARHQGPSRPWAAAPTPAGTAPATDARPHTATRFCTRLVPADCAVSTVCLSCLEADRRMMRMACPLRAAAYRMQPIRRPCRTAPGPGHRPGRMTSTAGLLRQLGVAPDSDPLVRCGADPRGRRAGGPATCRVHPTCRASGLLRPTRGSTM